MKRIQLAIIGAAFLVGCGALGSVIRTTLDIARCLCETVAVEQPDRLGGLTPTEWCEVEKNIAPFIDEVTRARAAASQKAGFPRVAP